MSTRPGIDWLRLRLDPAEGRCYALIDCARDSRLYGWLENSALERQGLFTGIHALRLGRYGPHLVQFPLDSSLAERWSSDQGQGWRRDWGWIFQSRSALSALAMHFKKFLRVETPGGPCYWRFYDPRVLSLSLPQLSREQQSSFFGGCVQRLFCFESKRQRLLEFWPEASLLERALIGSRTLHARVHPGQVLLPKEHRPVPLSTSMSRTASPSA